jgi:PAS domain S-box-containing protein
MSERWVVLIVDDSDDDRADVRRDLLRGADRKYRFLEATTGAAALSLCQNFAPAAPTCVVLDYSLPDMDALELLKALRGSDELPGCPVVVLTESEERNLGRNALRAGAMDCLGKSWMNPESLTRAVENAVERHQLLRRRAEAEARLRESDERLRLAMEAADAGMWDWDVATGAVTWSPGCYPIFGLDEGDFAGTTAAFDRLVHPDDRDRVWRSVRTAVAQQTRYEADFRVVRPDGRPCWVMNVGRAIYDDGGPVRMLGMVADITARKMAEQAAREGDDRLRYVMRASGVGTWSIDLASGTMECSAECRQIFGVAEGEPFTTLDEGLARMHPDDRDLQAAAMLEAVGQRREYEAEYRAVWPNGDTRWVLARGQGVSDDERTPWRIMGITLDITDRKAAEQVARDASRQKDEFLAVVAHELRGPLSPVRTAAALLTRVSPPDSDGARYAGVIGRQVAHMARMLDDLLDATRLSQGMLTAAAPAADAEHGHRQRHRNQSAGN